MAGWFELNKSSDGQFRVLLKDGNSATLLTSELYHAKSSAENGIASVQANSGLDERYEKKVSSNGKPDFNLRAGNHQVIGTSKLYESEAACAEGLAAVKSHGASKTIKDHT